MRKNKHTVSNAHSLFLHFSKLTKLYFHRFAPRFAKTGCNPRLHYQFEGSKTNIFGLPTTKGAKRCLLWLENIKSTMYLFPPQFLTIEFHSFFLGSWVLLSNRTCRSKYAVAWIMEVWKVQGLILVKQLKSSLGRFVALHKGYEIWSQAGGEALPKEWKEPFHQQEPVLHLHRWARALLNALQLKGIMDETLKENSKQLIYYYICVLVLLSTHFTYIYIIYIISYTIYIISWYAGTCKL